MSLKIGDNIKVLNFDCGARAIRKFHRLGIKYDSILEIISIQTVHGHIIIKVGNTTVSIGRNMFDKLKYELLNDNSG